MVEQHDINSRNLHSPYTNSLRPSDAYMRQ